MQIYFQFCETGRRKNYCNTCRLAFNYAKPEDQKPTATNADLLLIMRNLKSKKQLQKNADLLLIMRNLKTKKHLQQIQIYFYLCETLKITKTETNANFLL